MGRPDKEEDNPLRGAAPRALLQAIWDVIKRLEEVRTRSPAERQRLAQDTLHLLRELSWRFHAPSMPGSPEQDIKRALRPDVVSAFAGLNERLASEGARAARVETITRAAELVLDTQAHDWLQGERYEADGPLLAPSLQRVGKAQASDEGLLTLLAELEAIRQEQGGMLPRT